MSTGISKDRALLCSFTFADGRRCRTPRCTDHPHLCLFHARKETEAAVTTRFAHKVARFFPNPYVSACGLTRTLANLLCVTSQGFIKPKTACALGYLSQTLLQAIPLAKDEYIQVFGTNAWRDAIYDSIYPPAPPSQPVSEPESKAGSQPDSESAPKSDPKPKVLSS